MNEQTIIDRCRDIVAEHQYQEINGQIVDATTASMLIRVHDALSEENQAKFAAYPLDMMVAVGWSCIQ